MRTQQRSNAEEDGVGQRPSRSQFRAVAWSLLLTVLLASCQSRCGSEPPAPDPALSAAITRLMASLRTEDGRDSAQAALVAIGEPAVPELSKALGNAWLGTDLYLFSPHGK